MGMLDYRDSAAVLIGEGNYGAVLGSEGTGDSYFAWSNVPRWRVRRLTTSVVGAAAATVTASNFIPAGAVVMGLILEVTSTFSNASLTGINLGDGSDADLWGASIALTTGTRTTSASWTAVAAANKLYTAANNVVLTGVGANFAANGAATLELYYFTF